MRPCSWVKFSIFGDGMGVSDKGLEFEKTEKIQKPIEEILQPLDSMIGMEHFKETVRRIILRERQALLNEQRGMNPKRIPISMVLAGNPGTGKTTVAEKFCEVLYNAELIREKN